METLVEYEADGALSERLATSWEQVEPTAWEFELREGVQFQDGTPMDAEAVAGALTHLLEAKTPARSFNPDGGGRRRGGGREHVRIHHKEPDVLLPTGWPAPSTGILAPEGLRRRADRHRGHLHRAVHGG